MKKNQLKSKKQSTAIRLTSFAWASLLIVPLVIFANNTGNRFLFHVLLFITGWHSWSFTEYFLHRFIMHESTQEKGLGKLLDHTHHHIAPDDIKVKFNHRVILVIGCVLFGMISYSMNNYFTLLFGFLTGLSAYSLMHFILHQSWSKKLFPNLHKAHVHHHCKYSDKYFGVITTWWDYLFGTVPVKNIVITEKIREFYYRHESTTKRKSARPIMT